MFLVKSRPTGFFTSLWDFTFDMITPTGIHFWVLGGGETPRVSKEGSEIPRAHEGDMYDAKFEPHISFTHTLTLTLIYQKSGNGSSSTISRYEELPEMIHHHTANEEIANNIDRMRCFYEHCEREYEKSRKEYGLTQWNHMHHYVILLRYYTVLSKEEFEALFGHTLRIKWSIYDC